MNSQLMKMEAIINGYVEGIALDANGYVSEGSGENVFVVRNGVLQTAPLGNSVLPGITRNSVLHDRSRAGHSSGRSLAFRAKCYTSRTKCSSPGPPPKSRLFDPWTRSWSAMAERSRSPRPSRKSFIAIVRGEKPDKYGWLTPVPVSSKQPVTV